MMESDKRKCKKKKLIAEKDAFPEANAGSGEKASGASLGAAKELNRPPTEPDEDYPEYLPSILPNRRER